MKTISVTAHFDGEHIRLDERLGLEPLNISTYLACVFTSLRPICQKTTATVLKYRA